MLIKKVDIEGYKRLESVNIKRLEIEFFSPIIVIIGTNGCGKSSLLSVLTPYSHNKKGFTDEGRVALEIEHDDKIFNVGVDYKEKYLYYFKEDGVNKNDSGNVGTHNHTVDEYFNYSNEIDKLMRMKYRMSSMKENERKEMLMHFNPYDLSMVLSYQKKVSSTWRSIKNNIKMLSQRKSVLEDKTIPKDEMDRLKKDVERLKTDYENYDRALLLGQTRLNYLVKELNSYNGYGFENISIDWFSVELKNIVASLKKIWKEKKEVFIEGRFIKVEDVIKSIENIQREVNLLEIQIQDKISKLNEYKSYQQLDLEKEIKPRKDRIEVIEKELSSISNFLMDIPELSIDTYKELQTNYIPMIFQVIQKLVRDKVKIFPSNSLNTFKSHFHHLSYLMNNLINEINQFKEQKEKLEDELMRINRDTYPNDCFLVNCNLRNNIDKRKRVINDQIEQIEKSNIKKEKKINVYNKAIKHLSLIIENSLLYKDEMEVFRGLHGTFSWILSFICGGKKLIDVLNKDINDILINSKRLLTEIENRCTFYNLQEEKKNILFELIKLEDPKIPVNELINDIVGHLEKEVKSMQVSYLILIDKLKMLTSYEKCSKEYNLFHDRIVQLKKRYEVYQKYYLLKIDCEIFEVIVNHLIAEKESIKDVMIKSEMLMKEQENIYLILYKEIIPTLEDLIQKEKKYALVDSSLNPNSGLPRKYLVGYLNGIINNANYILSQTWNYELQIVPLDKEGEIDFKFERIVNGEKADDISLCSESQKDIIDIAWNLAMILTMGFGKKYPIYFDEIDKHFDEGHREKLISLFNSLINNDNIRQLFLVNHHAALSSGLRNCQTICLSTNNISVPEVYNENVIVHFK